jgi:hypothetical protein
MILAVAVALLGVSAAVLLWPSSDTAPVAHSVSNAVIPNVTQADLDSAGIFSVTTAEGLSASVDSVAAEKTAVDHDRGKVLTSQLVQLSNARYHNLLAWAVSLDPLSGPIFQPSGGPPNGCHYALDGPASFVLTFVDATTGKWITELQKARVKPLGTRTDGTVCP